MTREMVLITCISFNEPKCKLLEMAKNNSREITTTSTWNNFNISNPSVIKTNNEVLLFEVKK